jgi:hypothetical protein
MRDRLIELIQDSVGGCAKNWAETIADHILAAGIVTPPCKAMQTVFFATRVCDKEGEEKYDTLEGECISFSLQNEGLWAYCRYKCGLTYWHLVEQDFGKTVFFTREEAEKALERREG